MRPGRSGRQPPEFAALIALALAAVVASALVAVIALAFDGSEVDPELDETTQRTQLRGGRLPPELSRTPAPGFR